jgi:hypothetical protein
MAHRTLVLCLSMIVLAAPLQAFGAGASDPDGAPPPPAAATNNASPEKVAPNRADAPGVMAPKATPSADAIKPNGSASSGRNDAAPQVK